MEIGDVGVLGFWIATKALAVVISMLLDAILAFASDSMILLSCASVGAS